MNNTTQEHEPRRVPFQMRLTESERALLDEVAERTGEKVTEIMRRGGINEARSLKAA